MTPSEKEMLKRHDEDIHRITKSVSSIDESIKQIRDVIVDQRIRDERLIAAIKSVTDSAERAHERIDNIDKNFGWVVKTIIGSVIVAAITAVVHFGGK